jgi:hypothetical protein
MKTLLAVFLSFAIAAAAQAGCGKTETNAGILKEFDAKFKKLVLEPAVQSKKGLTLTPKTKITGKDGKDAKIEDLKGLKLSVESEHGKVSKITVAAK